MKQLSNEWDAMSCDDQLDYQVMAEQKNDQRKECLKTPLPCPSGKTGYVATEQHKIDVGEVGKRFLKKVSLTRLALNKEDYLSADFSQYGAGISKPESALDPSLIDLTTTDFDIGEFLRRVFYRKATADNTPGLEHMDYDTRTWTCRKKYGICVKSPFLNETQKYVHGLHRLLSQRNTFKIGCLFKLGTSESAKLYFLSACTAKPHMQVFLEANADNWPKVCLLHNEDDIPRLDLSVRVLQRYLCLLDSQDANIGIRVYQYYVNPNEPLVHVYVRGRHADYSISPKRPPRAKPKGKIAFGLKMPKLTTAKKKISRSSKSIMASMRKKAANKQRRIQKHAAPHQSPVELETKLFFEEHESSEPATSVSSASSESGDSHDSADPLGLPETHEVKSPTEAEEEAECIQILHEEPPKPKGSVCHQHLGIVYIKASSRASGCRECGCKIPAKTLRFAVALTHQQWEGFLHEKCVVDYVLKNNVVTKNTVDVLKSLQQDADSDVAAAATRVFDRLCTATKSSSSSSSAV